MAVENNLELWDSVSATDPAYTTRVEQRGGFTAICQTYQLREATRTWGKYGGKWGLRDIEWKLLEAEGEKPSIVLSAEFYYPGGAFGMLVDLRFKAGDDVLKKALTNCRSKCLATLGFSADVYLGSYDDNSYVADMRAKFSDEDELRQKIVSKIRTATDDTMPFVRKRLDVLRHKGAINLPTYGAMLQMIDAQLHELANGGAMTDAEKEAIELRELQEELQGWESKL